MEYSVPPMPSTEMWHSATPLPASAGSVIYFFAGGLIYKAGLDRKDNTGTE